MKTDKEIEQEVQEMFDGMSREEFKQSLIDAGFEVEDSEPGYEGLILLDEQTNIRQWFGVIDKYDDNEINKTIDKLLKHYCSGLYLVYPSLIKFNNVVEFSNHIRSFHFENKGDQFRQEFFVNKGLPYLIKLCRINFDDNENLTANINYEDYILTEDIADHDLEEVRDVLMTIIDYLPDIVDKYIK
jgi:hypothetical protein